MRLAGIDAVLVDLDGTLVDTLGDFVHALDLMLADLGLPPVPPALVARLIGRGADHLVRDVLSHSGGSLGPATFEHASARYRIRYQEVNGRNARVFPGAVEGLGALQSLGLKLACVTNKLSIFTRPLLRQTGLEAFFTEVTCGDRFGALKPDPQPLLATCAALGCEPARTLMLGDSANDARAARAAGCPVVLVTYGYNHGQPVREVDADGFVDSIADLSIG
jgi:phosphoglycolate phosphatase